MNICGNCNHANYSSSKIFCEKRMCLQEINEVCKAWKFREPRGIGGFTFIFDRIICDNSGDPIPVLEDIPDAAVKSQKKELNTPTEIGEPPKEKKRRVRKKKDEVAVAAVPVVVKPDTGPKKSPPALIDDEDEDIFA